MLSHSSSEWMQQAFTLSSSGRASEQQLSLLEHRRWTASPAEEPPITGTCGSSVATGVPRQKV